MPDPSAIRVTAPFLLLAGYAALGFALLASFLWLGDGPAGWQILDEQAFRRLNGSLDKPGAWQNLWAIANSRLFDAVPGAILLGLYAHWMWSDQGRHWRARALPGFALAAFTVLWVQKVVKPWLDHGRLSPTLVLPDPVRLASEPAVAWVPMVKDHSYDSFPGDHAGVFLLVALVIGHLCGWRRGAVALALLPLLMLPRLFGGGHWLSDQIAGGGFVGLVGAALFLALLRLVLEYRERRAASA
jgi:membrane-associated phospholipid phosphatase